MVSKNIQRILEVKGFNVYMLCLTLCFSLSSFSQITISEVFPTRITRGMKMTVRGTDFLSADVNDISISGTIIIDVSSINIVSDTEITFRISYIDNATTPNQTGRVLTVAPGVNATDLIEYVRPVARNYYSTNPAQDRYRITEIFTNWDYNGNGYYRTNWYDDMDDSTWPNDRHDLLAFTIFNGANEVTYSTGVDDALLTANGITFTSQTFQAYSTNGVSGFPNNDSYLLMADEIDGVTGSTVLNDQVRATVYDVLIDGTNGQGLDLGTGISNFNKETDIRFFSGNGEFGAVNDGNPDLIITQMASPGLRDLYYYTDLKGNIIGRPVQIFFPTNVNLSPVLYKWKVDLYRMNTAVPYQVSYPLGEAFAPFGESRDVRMMALELSDFGISNNPSNINFIGNITNIEAQAGGTADMAFLAYNTGAFAIKSPKIEDFPLSRNICVVPSVKTIEFNSLGSIPGTPSTDPLEIPKETIHYQWFKDFDPIVGETSSSFTLSGTIDANILGNYKVRVSNFYGAIDLPVTLTEGGTPTFWDGTNWTLPPPFVAAGITVADDERNLVFSEDYSENVDLEGCDCRVLRDKTVTIPSNMTLKLYDEIVVEQELDVFDDFGVFVETIPAGQITFGDNASLLQTKAVTTNANSGAIRMNRDATNLNLYDYIYWSSPVANFNIGNIPGTLAYKWDPTAANGSSTGNWLSASGIMSAGEGYIKRVTDASDFTTVFTGIPNNGTLTVEVNQSGAPLPADDDDKHWNLVGNPYPSAINASAFLTAPENSNIFGAVYLWTRGDGIFNDGAVVNPFYGNFAYNYADEYLTYNGTGPSIPSGFDGNIASGQAFFVQVLDSSPATSDITFNNAMRYDAAENAYDNDQFFRSSTPENNSVASTLEKQLIWLGLVDETNASSIALVGYVDGASNGVDRLYDARRTGETMSIYSVLEDTKMTIQGRSYPLDTNDTVFLGLDLLEAGIYKIAIDQLQGSVFEDETQGVYLEDTYLNVVHDLRTAPYSFSSEAGTTKDRFVLRYTTDELLSVAEQNKLDTIIYVKGEHLYVKSASTMESIVIYDLTGKQIVTYKLDTNMGRAFNTAFQYPKGAYIAVINLDNNTVVGKKIIN